MYLSAARAPGPRRDGAARSSVAAPLCLAGLCVVALALTWIVAALVPATHVKDAVALYDLSLIGGPRLDHLMNGLLHLLDPALYTLWGVLLVSVALLRRRPRVALAVALVLSLAPLSAEMLKPLLAHPHAQVGVSEVTAASWPSGHATAATVLALCAVLVAPRRVRPLVAALGATFAAAVGVSLLVLAWHLPSDVLGGYLLASLWMALALTGLRIADGRSRGARLRRTSLAAPPAPATAGGVGAGVP
jgi:membrane-associated phospholipid phosphatase